MGQYDFKVDLKALVDAAKTTADVVKLKKDYDVIDYVPTKDHIANSSLWEAVDEFQDRWERGINAMTDDISEVAGRLGKVAMTYAEFEQDSPGLFAAAKTAIGSISKDPLLGGAE